MNPHTATPSRPSSTQWKVGKPASLWRALLLPTIFAVCVSLIIALIFTVAFQRVATHRAIRACKTGYLSCTVSMGFTLKQIQNQDPNEIQTVCGDGWRSCI